MTVDLTMFAFLILPFIPYLYTIVLQVLNIGVSCQKPQKFMDNRLQMKLFRGNERKTFGEVETHLVAKTTDRTGPGSIWPVTAGGKNMV